MSNAARLLNEAIAAHQSGQFAHAEKTYRKLLRLAPAHADALRLLGGLYLQKGQAEPAADCLEKAVRLVPNDPETLTNLGLALRKAGRFDAAAARYRQALDIAPDYAQALGNLAGLHHERGRAAEALACYDALLRLAPDSPAAHYNYGNTLFAMGRLNDAAARYEHALKLKPDYTEAMVNLGMALSHAGKADQSRPWLAAARGWFEKALQTDPGNVAALNNLGNVLRQQGHPDQAAACFRQALALRPDYAEAAINLATSLRDLGDYDAAVAICRAALAVQPNSPNARINLGTFFQELMRHDEAIALFDEALALKPSSVDATWNKALSLMALGRYEEGLPLHEIGLGIPHMRGDNPSPERRWRGEDFGGKRLLLWCEQGLGDSLQFVRYAALAKQRGGQVIVLCPRVLRGLLRNCPFIDALPESVEEKDFDIHAPMMSLPYIFNTTLATIPAATPYLFVSDAKRAQWAPFWAQAESSSALKLKVGLVWAGNPREHQFSAHIVDRRRSMTLKQLRPLLDVPGVQWINLQMGAAAAQIDIEGLRDRMIDPMPHVADFEDTAALIEKMDLVLSVDTSVVHLAGGLGKPVWVLSRFDACWRWLQNRPDSPWYPTARLFGQSRPGDWESVVERVQAELAGLARSRLS